MKIEDEERLELRHAGVSSVVASRCASGHPQVLRCHPLHARDGIVEPFPTLYWLVCAALSREVAELERAGVIAELEARVDREESLRAALHADHQRYAALRWASLSVVEQALAESRGFAAALRDRGIAGMRSFTAVKCLHAHVAHHLVDGNTIGRLCAERLVSACAPRPG